MLNILLGILKVIGILLAVLLALVLIILLIILLGPIGYWAEGIYKEEKACLAGVSWMGFVLRFQADYRQEQGFQWFLRLFGIMIASNQEEFIEKQKEKKKRREEKKQQKEKNKQGEPEIVKEESQKEKKKAQELPMELLETEKDSIKAVQEKTKEEKESIPDSFEHKDYSKREEPANPSDVPAVKKEKKKITVLIKEKMALISKKISELIQKIKAIPDKIRNVISTIQSKIEAVKEKVRQLLEWKEFFLGEKNRAGFLHVLKNIKKMVIHILPRKIQGTVEFGVEEPYTMGQILTVLSIFYPVYQDKLTIHPDFENPGFACEGSLKGRIIPGYLLLRLIIAICNREVIRIIKEGRQLIGGNKK